MTDLTSLKILVTGSSGFIGTNLCAELMARGVVIRGLDIAAPKIAGHKSIWRRVDVNDASNVYAEISNFLPDVVIHLAARTDLDGTTIEAYRTNVEGTRNVLEAARECARVRRVIFASSRLVNHIGYAPTSDVDYTPSTLYGESKVLGEQVVRNAQKLPFSWCIVRPTSIWGPWFGVPYRDFFDAVLARRYVHPAGHRIRKSFGYVGNVVFELVILSTTNSAVVDGKTFYVADYEPIEVLAFAREIGAAAGTRPVLEVPFFVLKLAAWCGDGLKAIGFKRAPLTSFRLRNLNAEMLYDFSALSRLTGPLPYSASQGIAETLRWLNRVTS